jgi:hypothetical protein
LPQSLVWVSPDDAVVVLPSAELSLLEVFVAEVVVGLLVVDTLVAPVMSSVAVPSVPDSKGSSSPKQAVSANRGRNTQRG